MTRLHLYIPAPDHFADIHIARSDQYSGGLDGSGAFEILEYEEVAESIDPHSGFRYLPVLRLVSATTGDLDLSRGDLVKMCGEEQVASIEAGAQDAYRDDLIAHGYAPLRR